MNPSATSSPVRNLLTLTACVGISAIAFMSGNSDPKSLTGVGIIESKQFSLHIHVPNAGVMECAIQDIAPKFIELNFVPVAPVDVTNSPRSSYFVRLFNTIGATVFASFYEAHKEWLRATYTGDARKWPAILNFGRIVRNAVSHCGNVHFEGKTPAPGSWHHLAYSYPADQGRKLIGGDLHYPELLILMIEMSGELDHLGAPIPA
jgi:hypothetical protein